ncbi:MAG: ATP-binding cassette domain-containing protein, partial [Planctomycetota bacterium]
MQNSPALEIGDLSRAFGKIRALDGVSLTVPRQSIFGLVGPNGAGKTTLFNIVAGFLRADEGSVRVLGTGVRGIARLLGRVSILPQDALFERNVPILDQLIFFRRLGGRSREQAQEEVKEALTRVGLHDYMERGVQ